MVALKPRGSFSKQFCNRKQTCEARVKRVGQLQNLHDEKQCDASAYRLNIYMIVVKGFR